MKRRTGYILLFLILVALVVRLGFAYGVSGLDAPVRAGEADYHALAVNIAEGDGYVDEGGQPTGRRLPGYPAFLSGLYRLAGPRPSAARHAQVFLSVLVVVLVFSIARRHFGPNVALVAAAFAALNPFLVFASGYGITENLYTVTLLVGLRVMPRLGAADAQASRWLFGAVVLALAALVQSPGLAVAVWVGVVIPPFARGEWTVRLAQSVLLVLVLAAVLLPWAFRNQTTFGRWVGLSTHGGVTFYQGNNAMAVDTLANRGGATPLGGLPGYRELARLDEGARDREAGRLARVFLRENKGALPRLARWKLERFWRWKSGVDLTETGGGRWVGSDTVIGRAVAAFDADKIDPGLVYAAVAFPLFLVGLFVTRRRWREFAFYYGVVVVHMGYAMVFFGSIRGRIPVEPIIAVFAAAALAAPVKWYRSRRRDA